MKQLTLMIGIIDYHLNNLRSVQKAFEKVGAQSFISDKPMNCAKRKACASGRRCIRQAMENLRLLGLTDVLGEHAASGRPLLGICLGMQLLFTKSKSLGV